GRDLMLRSIEGDEECQLELPPVGPARVTVSTHALDTLPSGVDPGYMSPRLELDLLHQARHSRSAPQAPAPFSEDEVAADDELRRVLAQLDALDREPVNDGWLHVPVAKIDALQSYVGCELSADVLAFVLAGSRRLAACWGVLDEPPWGDWVVHYADIPG